MCRGAHWLYVVGFSVCVGGRLESSRSTGAGALRSMQLLRNALFEGGAMKKDMTNTQSMES